MKSIDKTFSLFDFCKKKASKVQIYGEETLDDDGNIISFIDQAALITHYLQLKDSEISLPYVSKAESILGLWYEFIKGEKKICTKDLECARESSVLLQTYSFPRFVSSTVSGTRES